MRILLWNCKGGISRKVKIEYFKSFSPDIAVVPEIREKNIELLAPDSNIWITNNHLKSAPKGLGVLAFNGFKLEPLPRDEEMEIFIPVKVIRDEFSFNLLAVWNFYSACKQGRFQKVRGPKNLEFSALEYYKSLFTDPSLIVGDWNLGPTFSKDEFVKIVGILDQQGLKSIYHHQHNIFPAETRHSTFRAPKGKVLHHLDHIFGSELFYKNVKTLLIDEFQNVVLSDHAPIVLDVNICSAKNVALLHVELAKRGVEEF